MPETNLETKKNKMVEREEQCDVSIKTSIDCIDDKCKIMTLWPNNSSSGNIEETEVNHLLKSDMDEKNNIYEEKAIKDEIVVKEESFEDASDLACENDIFKPDSQNASNNEHCEVATQDCFSNKVSKKGSLQIHLRTRTSEKLFKCSHCSYQSSWKGNLQIHLRTHTGEKPYKCSYCSYQSSQKGSLQVHIRTHTGAMNLPYLSSYAIILFCVKCPKLCTAISSN